jgi:hypothetical protein
MDFLVKKFEGLSAAPNLLVVHGTDCVTNKKTNSQETQNAFVAKVFLQIGDINPYKSRKRAKASMFSHNGLK